MFTEEPRSFELYLVGAGERHDVSLKTFDTIRSSNRCDVVRPLYDHLVDGVDEMSLSRDEYRLLLLLSKWLCSLEKIDTHETMPVAENRDRRI
jgi:hypothetical protein